MAGPGIFDKVYLEAQLNYRLIRDRQGQVFWIVLDILDSRG